MASRGPCVGGCWAGSGRGPPAHGWVMEILFSSPCWPHFQNILEHFSSYVSLPQTYFQLTKPFSHVLTPYSLLMVFSDFPSSSTPCLAASRLHFPGEQFISLLCQTSLHYSSESSKQQQADIPGASQRTPLF